jgi:hypothetical protein
LPNISFERCREIALCLEIDEIADQHVIAAGGYVDNVVSHLGLVKPRRRRRLDVSDLGAGNTLLQPFAHYGKIVLGYSREGDRQCGKHKDQFAKMSHGKVLGR